MDASAAFHGRDILSDIVYSQKPPEGHFTLAPEAGGAGQTQQQLAGTGAQLSQQTQETAKTPLQGQQFSGNAGGAQSGAGVVGSSQQVSQYAGGAMNPFDGSSRGVPGMRGTTGDTISAQDRAGGDITDAEAAAYIKLLS